MIDLLILVCFGALAWLGYSHYSDKKKGEKRLNEIGKDMRSFCNKMNEQMRKDSESGKLWKDGIPRKLNSDGSAGEEIKKDED